MVYRLEHKILWRSSMLEFHLRVIFFVAGIFAFVSLVFVNGSLHAESRNKTMFKKNEDHLKNQHMSMPRSGRQDVPLDTEYGKNPDGRYDGGSEPDPI
jgi:hypothetical protein